MKKVIITLIMIFPLWGLGSIFAQSITIAPSIANQTLEMKKLGIGLDHRDATNTVGFGTAINNGEAYFQTHTNHPLYFVTSNGSTAQMKLYTNGNLGIGNINPSTHKLLVQGNTYFSGNLASDGLVSVGSLTIGGGSTISKFFKVYLPEETTPTLNAKTCITKNYSVSGVSSTDIITMSIVGTLSGNIVIANVLPLANSVDVKFCNNGTTNSSVQTVDIKFNIIK